MARRLFGLRSAGPMLPHRNDRVDARTVVASRSVAGTHRERLVKQRARPVLALMIARGDILWLGIASGVCGGLVGGLLLGIGMDLVVNGAHAGALLVVVGAPASALPGWLLARRLARQT